MIEDFDMTRNTSAPLWPWWPEVNVNLPSGDVTQDILREWFSQKYEFNFAGNSKIEAEVVAKVASYGKQLGILSEAVLELAGRRKGDSLDRLEALVKKIDAIKRESKKELVEDAERALDTLQRADSAAFSKLMKKHKQ